MTLAHVLARLVIVTTYGLVVLVHIVPLMLKILVIIRETVYHLVLLLVAVIVVPKPVKQAVTGVLARAKEFVHLALPNLKPVVTAVPNLGLAAPVAPGAVGVLARAKEFVHLALPNLKPVVTAVPNLGLAAPVAPGAVGVLARAKEFVHLALLLVAVIVAPKPVNQTVPGVLAVIRKLMAVLVQLPVNVVLATA